MGIRFSCPNGHKLNVKTFLAGRRGVCPQCGARFVIPVPAELQASEARKTVTLGQSQTVEVIPPIVAHTTAIAAPASTIIQLVDTEVLHHPGPAQSPAHASHVAVPPIANPGWCKTSVST